MLLLLLLPSFFAFDFFLVNRALYCSSCTIVFVSILLPSSRCRLVVTVSVLRLPSVSIIVVLVIVVTMRLPLLSRSMRVEDVTERDDDDDDDDDDNLLLLLLELLLLL